MRISLWNSSDLMMVPQYCSFGSAGMPAVPVTIFMSDCEVLMLVRIYTLSNSSIVLVGTRVCSDVFSVVVVSISRFAWYLKQPLQCRLWRIFVKIILKQFLLNLSPKFWNHAKSPNIITSPWIYSLTNAGRLSVNNGKNFLIFFYYTLFFYKNSLIRKSRLKMPEA